MEAAKSVAIGYNRVMVRKRIFYILSLFPALLIVTIFPFFRSTDNFHHSWVSVIFLLIYTFIWLEIISLLPLGYGNLILCYWRNLSHNEPAFLIEKRGIFANAAGNPYGLLKWEEIARIYPWTVERRLFSNRLFTTPIIYKEPGVIIAFKENLAIKRHPAWRRLYTRREAKSGPGTWLFIPETLLAVTTTELIQQINHFYMAQVRGY